MTNPTVGNFFRPMNMIKKMCLESYSCLSLAISTKYDINKNNVTVGLLFYCGQTGSKTVLFFYILAHSNLHAHISYQLTCRILEYIKVRAQYEIVFKVKCEAYKVET